MKMKKMSKLMVLILIGIMVFVACSNGGDGPTTDTTSGDMEEVDNLEDKVYKIGISQLAEHPALDDARQGFEDGLEELGIKAEIDYKNAQGDITNTVSIAQKFVSDKMDLIFAIATPAAQSAKQATREIPILFSAVTDPVKAGIVEDWERVGVNITGTSDMAPTESQLEMFKEIDPSIEKIGILYNTSEANSEIQIDEVKALAPAQGLEVETVGVNNVNELPQAIDSLIKKVDALYIISDNMVASSVELVSKLAIDNGMVTVSAEESQVGGGILITNGLSYYELGKQTARMAKEILVDKVDINDMPVGVAEKTITTVNQKTLDALEIDKELELFKNAEKVGL